MPSNIYHYTNLKGLMGILGLPNLDNHTEFNCPELWLTESKFLNDHMEANYFIDTFNELKNEILNIIPPHFIQEDVWNSLSFDIECPIDNMVAQDDLYIMSFTTEVDHLPLWSLYTNLDEANNQFCIGFPIEDLKNTIKHSLKGTKAISHFKEILYLTKPELKEYILTKLVPNYLENFGDNGLGVYEYDHIFIKHKKFEYEKEYRLVVRLNGEDDLQFFQNKDNIIIPKIKIPLICENIMEDPFGLKRNLLNFQWDITTGPFVDFNRVFHGLKYLNKDGLVVINQSEIPLRKT